MPTMRLFGIERLIASVVRKENEDVYTAYGKPYEITLAKKASRACSVLVTECKRLAPCIEDVELAMLVKTVSCCLNMQ